MTNFRIIGAAALSLVLAGPALAANHDGYGMHGAYHGYYGRATHRMPAQDFDHLDLGIAPVSYTHLTLPTIYSV